MPLHGETPGGIRSGDQAPVVINRKPPVAPGISSWRRMQPTVLDRERGLPLRPLVGTEVPIRCARMPHPARGGRLPWIKRRPGQAA